MNTQEDVFLEAIRKLRVSIQESRCTINKGYQEVVVSSATEEHRLELEKTASEAERLLEEMAIMSDMLNGKAGHKWSRPRGRHKGTISRGPREFAIRKALGYGEP